jgi:hypothetical protein
MPSKNYRTDRGSPRAHGLSDPAADALAELKIGIYEQSTRGNWGHRISSSIVIEFLIWWLHETQREGKTEIRVRDFRPKTRPGRPQSSRNEPSICSEAIRKQAQRDAKQAGEKPIDQMTAKRKLR